MTREEAMYLLNNLRSVAEGKEDEAIDMAIEALSVYTYTEQSDKGGDAQMNTIPNGTGVMQQSRHNDGRVEVEDD